MIDEGDMMKIALAVNKERNVTGFNDYDSIDIFTFEKEVPIRVESLPKLTSLSMRYFLVRALANRGVYAILAKDMDESDIAAFLKRGIKVKLACKANGKLEAIKFVREDNL